MLNKNLEEIDLNDLEQLVTDGVPEGKTIEYKRDFYRLDDPDGKTKQKQHEEMLKDISSFANTLGGDLIIGVEDTDGKPSYVCGFDVLTGTDKLKFAHPATRSELAGAAGRRVDLLRGHRTGEGGSSSGSCAAHRPTPGHLWGQAGAVLGTALVGTFEMDTHELRQAFTNSASVEEKIAEWREQAHPGHHRQPDASPAVPGRSG